ncbi:MAG: hypothetical protein WDM77_13510 [Steroidobacteraceae bacterium]
MFIADPQGHGHGNDSPQHRAPEGVNEGLVVAQKQDQVIAAFRAQFLQMEQYPQSPGVQIAEGDAALVLFAPPR